MDDLNKTTRQVISVYSASETGAALRERAESTARQKSSRLSETLETLSPKAMRKALHELNVHQIELQMQNEELQRAQIELAKAKSLYFDLYDMAPVGYCTVSEQDVIKEANLAAATLLGTARGSLVGQRLTRYIAQSSQDSYYMSRKQLIASGNSDACDLQLVKADGAPLWVTLTTTTTLEDKDDGAWVLRVVLHDITERMHATDLLNKKNLELETARSVADKANLAKSEFLSAMSHELRTPLNAILGFAQLIEMEKPSLTPDQKRHTDHIISAGWYLLDLINQVLDLALIESGKLSVELRVMALAEVMQECQVLVEPEADKHGVSVTFAAFAAPYFLMIDRTRFKQVLLNLLSNAIKYNKPGGTVALTCIETERGRVRISIEDTGQGLSPAQIAHLFEPFNRLGQAVRAEPGTGIGLTITKHLIELMGGIMGVQSLVGKGSTFWFDMDLATARIPVVVPNDNTLPPDVEKGGPL